MLGAELRNYRKGGFVFDTFEYYATAGDSLASVVRALLVGGAASSGGRCDLRLVGRAACSPA